MRDRREYRQTDVQKKWHKEMGAPSKKEWQNEIFQKVTFFEMFPDSKQDIKKPWDLHSVLYK